ncbi:MAG: hypothetical protein AAF573_19175 [Bacteroidota bacterium]
MKLRLLTLLILIGIISYPCFSQKKVKGDFKFTLYNGYLTNKNFPIFLEEEVEKEEVLFTIDGNDATRKYKDFERIKQDTAITFVMFTGEYSYNLRDVVVQIEQDGDKLVLNLKGETLEAFEKYNEGKKRRLVIDIGDGVKIRKFGFRVNAFTIPFKVFLSNRSETLANFTNNVETSVNGGVTLGISNDYYLFRKGRDPKLTNTFGLFSYFGLNRLDLNHNNTDFAIEDDTILSISFALGAQFGYRRFSTGLLFGIDAPFSSLGENWVFRNRPWLGLGIGYALSD